MTNPVRDANSKSDPSSHQPLAATSSIEQELLRKMVFRQLQPICTRILPLRDSVAGLTAILPQLKSTLAAVDAVGLQGCMDYALYPLLHGIDSIALTRTGEHATALLKHVLLVSLHVLPSLNQPFVTHCTVELYLLEDDSSTIIRNASLWTFSCGPCPDGDESSQAVVSEYKKLICCLE